MTATPQQPGSCDAVLGGASAAPSAGAVLGGWEGVQRRLTSHLPEQRMAALREAISFDVGLESVLMALYDPSERVQQHAYQLLSERHEPTVQAALHRYRVTVAQQQLSSALVEQRLQALSTALELGQEGLNLVIRALNDEALAVQQAAFDLLRDRPESQVRHALRQFSAQGINYNRLRQLLAAGRWQLADQETRHLVYRACGLQPTDVVNFPQFEMLPCDDLQQVDYLWCKYSNGRFGFSVQQPIWQYCFTTYWDKTLIWSTFGDRVGWRVNHLLKPNHWKRHDELTFSLDAPVGHLPFLGNRFGIFTIEAIARRVLSCELGR